MLFVCRCAKFNNVNEWVVAHLKCICPAELVFTSGPAYQCSLRPLAVQWGFTLRENCSQPWLCRWGAEQMTGTPLNNRRMLTVVQMDEGLLAACQQRLVYTAGSLCSIKGCIQMYTEICCLRWWKYVFMWLLHTHTIKMNPKMIPRLNLRSPQIIWKFLHFVASLLFKNVNFTICVSFNTTFQVSWGHAKM